MSVKAQRALCAFGALFVAALCARAQLRPDNATKPAQPPKPAQIVVQTSPNAEVYLTFKGKASAQGRLVIDNLKPGEHALRIALGGKKDYERQVNAAAGQVTKVDAVSKEVPIAAPTTIILQTSPNAQIYLDETFKGDSSPERRLVIDNAKPGSHSLRVTLAGKKTTSNRSPLRWDRRRSFKLSSRGGNGSMKGDVKRKHFSA